MVGVCAALAGCSVQVASTPTTAPPTASPTPPVAEVAKPAPAARKAEVKAIARGGSDENDPLVADITVTIGDAEHSLALRSELTGCESTEAPVDTIPGIEDPRLRMVQLFCENGEDLFTRQIVTALLVAGDSPWIAWKGSGEVATADGECERAEVPAFRAAPGGKVEVVIESGCGDTPTTRVVATVDVSKPGAAP